jgi:type II secretory pathway pseudopilin PulG
MKLNLKTNRYTAFTLIEMLGVLAMTAILAAALVPALIGQTDQAVSSQENATLQGYATALQNNIMRNRYIPGPSDWSTTLATEVGANVATVLTNLSGLPRYYVIDPALQIGTNAAGVLPYAQTNMVLSIATSGQMSQPVSPRVMIVSSTATPLPSSIISGSGTLTSANFSNLWNWVNGSVQPPVGWPANWNNHGLDLQVQRINLTPLFVHLLLNNYPPPPLESGQGQYAIDGLVTNLTPNTAYPTNGVSAYFIKSTKLGFFQGSGAGGALQANQILQQDANFYYIQNAWRGYISYGLNLYPSNSPACTFGSCFEANAAVFTQCPTYNNNHHCTPQLVYGDMTNFMAAYNAWGDAGFPFDNGTLYNNAHNCQATMINDMNNLCQNLPGFSQSGNNQW